MSAGIHYSIELLSLSYRLHCEGDIAGLWCTMVSNRYAASENFNDGVYINRACENIEENMKTSPQESLDYYKLKPHKPRFDDDCSKLLHQRKEAKLQWLQNPNQINGDNKNNVRHESCGNFR
jgi:hypothetical protein